MKSDTQQYMYVYAHVLVHTRVIGKPTFCSLKFVNSPRVLVYKLPKISSSGMDICMCLCWTLDHVHTYDILDT